MIIFLYGLDTYRSRQKLEELKKKFIREVDKSGLDIIKLTKEDITISKFREAVLTPAFFSRKRMIIIENICQSKDSQLKNTVLKFIERHHKKDDNIIIFWEDIAKSNDKLFTRLTLEKYSQEFPLLNNYKLTEWIKKEVIKQKGKIEKAAVDFLISLGPDLWLLSNEINKLISYKGDKVVALDDVKLLVKPKIDENVFNLVDAIGRKDKNLALKLLNEQLESGISWSQLWSMIIRQFRILLQIKFSFLTNSSDSELNLHPYVLKKTKTQAKNYSLEELKDIYERLLKIDSQLKTTSIDPKVLFNLFIVKY